MKRVLLVNGVPASGKSTVARAVAMTLGWPLMTLDTVKEALFDQLGIGDREHNRRFGKASYQAMFALIGDFPPGSTTVVDAWFGFQPEEVLLDHLARSGATEVAEIWCHARPSVIGERYRARIGERSAGHLGASYVPELLGLATRARPLGRWPLLSVDTEAPLDVAALQAWLSQTFPQAGKAR